MSIVDEFSKLSPQQQRETIQRLSQGSPEEANKALFLSRYVSEQQGLNVTPSTTVNPTQAKQIKETQSYNQIISEQAQLEKQSNITQTAIEKQAKASSPLGPQPGTPAWSVQGSYVETGSKVYTKEGALVGTVGSKDMPALTPGKSYQIETPQRTQPTKQSDYGLVTQMDIAARLGIQGFNAIINKSDNQVLKTLAKAELEYAVSPVLGGVVGGAATLESNVYGTASIINSVYQSAKTGNLQYKPVETPILAPTVLGGSINAVLGDSSELKQITEMPGLYRVGYGFGSAGTEVGLALVEGVGLGFVAGKTSNVFRQVINPRVNQIAESTLARSKLFAQSGLNKISPGLGQASDIVFSKDTAKIVSRIDRADASLTGKMSAARLNVKYGLTEPFKQKAGFAYEKAVVKTESLVPQQIKEARLYARSVVSPNLVEYGKPFKTSVNMVKSSELYQGTKFSINQVASKIKMPIDLKVPLNQAAKGKYLLGNIKQEISGSTIKPLTRATKTGRGVVSTKNISASDALGIATKRKSQLRGVAYEDTFKMNRGNQIVKQVQKQSLTTVKASVKASSKFGVALSGASSFAGAYPGVQKKRYREDYEVVSLPRSRSDLKITQDSDLRLTPIRVAATRLSKQGGLTPSSLTPKYDISPLPKQRKDNLQDLRVVPSIIPKQTSVFAQGLKQSFTVKQAQSFTQAQKFKVPTDFWFRVAGGSGGLKSSSNLRGKWRKQDNPVKNINAMLKTFGLNTNSRKPTRKSKRRTKR